MTLKYIQEHNVPDYRPNPSEKELTVKDGELYRGEVDTGIALEKSSSWPKYVFAGLVIVAGIFVARRYLAESNLSE